jgi:hypothetical protein
VLPRCGAAFVPFLLAAAGCGDEDFNGACAVDPSLVGSWSRSDDSAGADEVVVERYDLGGGGGASWQRSEGDAGATDSAGGSWCAEDGALRVSLGISDGEREGVSNDERTYAVAGIRLYWGEFLARRAGSGLAGEWRAVVARDETWDDGERCRDGEELELSMDGAAFELRGSWSEDCSGGAYGEDRLFSGSVLAEEEDVALTVEIEDGAALAAADRYPIVLCPVAGYDAMAILFNATECPELDDMYQVLTRQ